MNQQTPLGLFDLLARSWNRAAAVEAAVFSADGSTVAFAAADGTVALARVADPESALSRVHVSSDLGQTTIRPPARAPRPLVSPPAFGASPPPLAPAGGADFLVGTEAGDLVRLNPAGEVAETGIRLGRAVTALTVSSAGLAAATDGSALLITPPRTEADPIRLDADDGAPFLGIAFARGGRRLALAEGDRLVIVDVETGARSAAIPLPAPARAPVWAPGDRVIATPLASGGMAVVELAAGRVRVFDEFPAPVRNVSFSGHAEAVFASGAFRAAAWSIAPAAAESETGGALLSGRPGMVLVERVAAHPTRSLVAVGYANGRILIAQIGGRDELLVKPAGGAVTALAWSPDGRHLAVGCADGTASLVTFPPQLFK